MKVALADVVERAADEFLWFGPNDQRMFVRHPSCSAVVEAIDSMSLPLLHEHQFGGAFDELIRDMGLICSDVEQFLGFREGPTRQQVRHAWLYLVAQVARERRIFVEVDK